MGESVNLEMLQKLMLDVQGEVKALRKDMDVGFASAGAELKTVREKVDGQSTLLVGIRRELRSLPPYFRRLTTTAAALPGSKRASIPRRTCEPANRGSLRLKRPNPGFR